MFTLSRDARELSLEADAIKKLTAGGEKKVCPKVREIKLELLIISEIMGEFKQIIKVPVKAQEPKKEEKEEQEDSSDDDDDDAITPFDTPEIKPQPKFNAPDIKD